MVSKMLVIKKVSKEDPSTAFSAGFATTGVLPTNGSKAPIAGSSVYKNLVPKPAVAPTKVSLYLFGFSDIFNDTVYFKKKKKKKRFHVLALPFFVGVLRVVTRWQC